MMLNMSPSDPEVVHPVPVEEVPGWAGAMASTFLHDPHNAEATRRTDLLRRVWDAERAWGARDRGRWVATLRSETRTLAVPGVGGGTRTLPVDAVTNVTVAATHRRRGLLRRMLSGSLRAARDRGDALSILIAAEWPIYGRFGYAPATETAEYVLHRTRPGAAVAGDPGRVRAVDRAEFGALAPAVYAAAQRRRSGQLDRRADWWNRVLGLADHPVPETLPHNWLVHEGDEGVDGLLAWTATRGEFGLVPPFGAVTVWGLVDAGDTAYTNLWAYLCGLDLVDEVHLAERPIDEPVRWLLHDARTLVKTQQVDFVWLRLLDVPRALAARRYAVPGEVVLEVIDEDGDRFAAGRFRLVADGDEVECSPTDHEPDLQITQRALASIYLGGFRLRELTMAGAAQERTAGALDRMDAMFSVARAPWNATWF